MDVRSALEVEEVGKVRDSVNIPWVICTRVWDPQEQKKVIKKEDNPDFIAQVGGRAIGGACEQQGNNRERRSEQASS